MAIPNQTRSSAIDYLKLQDMLKNMSMDEVSKVAQGMSGPVAQVFAMDEIGRRNQQSSEFSGEQAEQNAQNPPMINEYLAMAQQMMGSQIPQAQQPMGMAMAPSQPMPQSPQGIASMMPQAQPEQPTAMFYGGGMVRKFQDGGTTTDNTGEFTEEDIALTEDPSFVSGVIDWVSENPVEAALMGLSVAPIVSAGSSLLAGGVGTMALLRGLGTRGISFFKSALKSPLQTMGRRSFGKSSAKIQSRIPDEVTDLESARKLYQSQPFRMRTGIRDGRLAPVARTDAELTRALGLRNLGIASGAGMLGSYFLGDGEEQAPSEMRSGIATQAEQEALEASQASEGMGGYQMPTLPEEQSVPQTQGAWDAVIRAGAELARGQNWAEGLSNAIDKGMDTYIGQQELQRKRNADQFERDLKRAELESLSAQIPSKIELQEAQADYYRAGGSRANRSNNLTKSILDEINEMVRLEGYTMGSPEFMQRRNELIQIYLSSGPVGLFSPQGGIDSMEALLGEIR
jgi:hypothetical protein